MPKLPKKATMRDTINRVKGYTQKMQLEGKLTAKKYLAICKALDDLITEVEK